MRYARRGGRAAFLVAGLSLVRAAPLLAQEDTALRAWEPAAVTQLDPPRKDSEASAATPRRLTPDALQGPPTPATMYAIASLDRDQLYRYAKAYRAHMNATWDARYGVASAVKLLSQAVERHDEEAARYYGAIANSLWSRVLDEDRGFDDVVEALLRKGQLKRYRDWKRRLLEGEAVQGRLESAPAPAPG